MTAPGAPVERHEPRKGDQRNRERERQTVMPRGLERLRVASMEALHPGEESKRRSERAGSEERLQSRLAPAPAAEGDPREDNRGHRPAAREPEGDAERTPRSVRQPTGELEHEDRNREGHHGKGNRGLPLERARRHRGTTSARINRQHVDAAREPRAAFSTPSPLRSAPRISEEPHRHYPRPRARCRPGRARPLFAGARRPGLEGACQLLHHSRMIDASATGLECRVARDPATSPACTSNRPE